MNPRQYQMDYFIKYMDSVLHHNPSIYGNLVRYGVEPMANEGKPLAKLFSNWIEHFQNHPGINVYNAESWPYFCQFTKGSIYDDAETAIKIYVPLKLSHIEHGAKILFEFIASRGFPHQSKIGSDERIDNIVIRVSDKNAAAEISQFVNSNTYIREGLMNPNPFCINDGNIAYAADGHLSYNSVVSQYISDYLAKYHGQSGIGLEQFTQFVELRYREYFVSGNNSELISQNIESVKSCGGEAEFLTNYMQATELLMINVRNNVNIHDFINHVDALHLEKYTNEKRNRLDKGKQQSVASIEPKVIDMTPKQDPVKLEMIRTIIETNMAKYPTEQVVGAIKRYINSGNNDGFTRDNNSRHYVSLLKPQELLLIINGSLKPEQRLDPNYIELFVAKIMDRDYFKEACKATISKYGLAQTLSAINSYAATGFAKKFTNDNNARVNLVNNIRPTQIQEAIINALVENGDTLSEDMSVEHNASRYLNIVLAEMYKGKAANM